MKCKQTFGKELCRKIIKRSRKNGHIEKSRSCFWGGDEGGGTKERFFKFQSILRPFKIKTNSKNTYFSIP